MSLFMFAVLSLLQFGTSQKRYTLTIDSSKTFQTEDEYLSFTLDFSLKVNPDRPWYTLNFTHPRVHTLLKGLAPAHLRYGGTDGDFAIFYNTNSKSEQEEIIKTNSVATDKSEYGFIVAIFPQDIDNLYSVINSSNGRLIYGLNMELRYGPQWDSTNARELMAYMIGKGYSQRVDFELGNEPPYKKFTSAAFNATGARLAQDFRILRNVLDQYPEFKDSNVYGPDVETPRDGTYSGDQPIIMRDFVKNINSTNEIAAFTAHHYYFHGPDAKLDQFYDLTYFKFLESTLPKLRDTVYKAAGKPVNIWIGETSDSNIGGTPNITNSYASGFLWLDKLGLAAKNEIKMVIRQTFYGYNNTANYPLLSPSLYPNPDYWLSHVYKKLVGRTGFWVNVDSSNENVLFDSNNGLLRAYCHCTSPRSVYPAGSIVIYAVNLNVKEPAILNVHSITNDTDEMVDLYLMSPENDDLTSTSVQLNNVTLKMVDDFTLPEIKPVAVSTKDGITFPPLRYGFIVFKRGSIQSSMRSLCS